MIKKVQRNEGCIGCGSCEQHCPEIFKISSDGESEVISHDYDDKIEDITRAEQSCPVNVIEVTREGQVDLLSTYSATIIAKNNLNNQTLEVLLNCQHDFPFTPGQFILVHLSDSSGEFNRAYSIVKFQNNSITLCIALTDMGRGSAFWRDIALESEIKVSAPMGNFQLQNNTQAKLFLATGTGIAPCLSMLKALPNELPKTLYWGLRRESDLYYQDELKAISNLDLKICLSQAEENWQGLSGHITQHFTHALQDTRTEIYACGQAQMITQARERLTDIDYPKHHFFSESFNSSTNKKKSLQNKISLRQLHFYSSLIGSLLFLFFALSGLLANRPNLVSAKHPQSLPVSVNLEKSELQGWFKARYPDIIQLIHYEDDSEEVNLEYKCEGNTEYHIELNHSDRIYVPTKLVQLPKSTPLDDQNTIIHAISQNISGHVDLDSIESDEEFLYFSISSVWREITIEVDKTSGQYSAVEEGQPWVASIIDLHRSKQAGTFQKLLVDLTALLLLFVTLSGVVIGLQSPSQKRSVITLALVASSILLVILMLIQR